MSKGVVTRIRCAWCGTRVFGRTRCKACTRKLYHYKKYCALVHKTSDKQLLLDFKELLLDIKNNVWTHSELLPPDLDYQLDRVNLYIAREVD